MGNKIFWAVADVTKPYKQSSALEVIKCKNCGISMVRRPRRVGEGGRVYCSKKCRYEMVPLLAYRAMVEKLYGGRTDIKICPRCNKTKLLTEFYPEKGRRSRSICKHCEAGIRVLRKGYYLKYSKNQYANRSEDEKKKRAEYNKSRQSRIRKEESENLTDSYMRRLLARYSLLKESEIPQELIEYKRAIIKIKREIGK